MIKAENLTKRFDDMIAVDHINAEIKDASVFGLIGTNGAGKSTFLRMMSGVLKPDEGSVTIDGKNVFEREDVKQRFFYISDEQYFFSNATPLEMMEFYSRVYPKFDKNRFHKLLSGFELNGRRKVNTFSKGMDPVMRQAVKSIFAGDISERNLTPIIASHNLRELEDICDHVGLLHKGGILLSKDLDDMKLNIHKIQCVLREGMDADDLVAFDRLKTERRGKLITITVRGSREEAESLMESYRPVFYEIIPLSLEEIFISETEVAGYDIKKLIL